MPYVDSSNAILREGIALKKINSRDHVQVKGTWTFIWTDKNGKELRRRTEENLVVSTGLQAIAAIIAGNLDQDCAVWLALGTGIVAPESGDTTLGAESTRKVITTKTQDGASIIYRFYLLTGEAIGTFTEWGVYLGATSIADSGRLLNRLIPTGGVRKESGENLVIEVVISLAAA